MQTVQLTAYDRHGAALFFTIGMGVSYAAAKASARVGYRARVTADTKLAGKVHLIEAEAI